MSGIRFRTVIEAASGGGAAARIPADRDLANPISEAKKPETRKARLEKALAALRE